MNAPASLLMGKALENSGIGVNGGGGHLGRAIALGLAAAGARVVIFGRSEAVAKRIVGAGQGALAHEPSRPEDSADLSGDDSPGRELGAIVNIASRYGLVSPQPASYQDHPQFHNPPACGAARADVIEFTRYAACHLAGQGVRVNCVSPGPFPTPSVQRHCAFVEELQKRMPLGRIGRRDELAGPVAFLLSPLSSYVTGHNLIVDGGWTTW